ncbi:MAG: hypothetical protein JWR57_144 [Mycetocola sp.]|nr:hypothetical protein [Mycetocola sp.]
MSRSSGLCGSGGAAASRLRFSLTAYRDAGLVRAVLDVDTAGHTGTHSLYERMGFLATTRRVTLVKEC